MPKGKGEILPTIETPQKRLLNLRAERATLLAASTKAFKALNYARETIKSAQKDLLTDEVKNDKDLLEATKKALEVSTENEKKLLIEYREAEEKVGENWKAIKEVETDIAEEDAEKAADKAEPHKKKKSKDAATNKDDSAKKPQDPPKKPPTPPKAPANNADPKIVWTDTSYLNRAEKSKRELGELLAERRQRLGANISTTEKESIENEISIYEEHIKVLEDLSQIATDEKPYKYTGNVPRIEFNTRKKENDSGWKNRAYIAQVKRDIEGLMVAMDDIRKGMRNTTDTEGAEKEIAVRQLHIAKIWSLLEKALSTPAATKPTSAAAPKSPASPAAAPAPSPAPAATPASPAPTSGHNTVPAVQSNTIDTMNNPEKEFGDSALDTAGFAKYAVAAAEARGQDVEGLEADISSQRQEGVLLYETHQKLEKFSADLKKLFREDAAGIIKFSDEDFKSIDNYMEANRVTNPELIIDVMYKLEQVREDQRQIQEKEAKIRELTVKREAKIREYIAAQVKERTDAIAAGTEKSYLNKKKNKGLSFFNILGRLDGMYHFQSTAKAAIEAEVAQLNADSENMAVAAGTTRDLDAELAQFQTEKSDLEWRHASVKAEILKNSEYAYDIHVIAQQKVRERFNAMIQDSDKNLSSIDDHQDTLKKINELRESGFSFSYLNDDEAEVFQKEVDKEAEKTAEKTIEKMVGEIDLDKTNQYTKFENAVKTIINREQLGSKTKAESRNFIVETLQNKRDEFKKKDPARALYITHLIAKVRDLKL